MLLGLHKSDGNNLGKRVQVARMGEDVPAPKAFGLDADVDEILEAFDEELEKGEEVAINGSPVDGDYVPNDGACLYIAPSSTGA